MTVASDLQSQRCPRSMLFAQIDGLEPILCERIDDPPSADWTTRSRLACLRPPDEEFSLGLDLGTMAVRPSAMTFELDDIPEPTDSTLSYFARLFAPGRWSQSGVDRVLLKPVEDGGAAEYVGAADTSIDVVTTSGFDASGTAYLGQETFSYTSLSATSFEGCSRGLYPAVGTALGGTYRRPTTGGADGWLEVTSVPYSWLGRVIALYIVTYDELTGAWNAYADAELLWVGRVTDRGTFVPERACWQLVAEHILNDLERQIAVDLPRSQLEGINLSGTLGRVFTAELRWVNSTATNSVAYISIDADIYTSSNALWSAIMYELNTSANWSGTAFNYVWFSSLFVDGKYTVMINNSHGSVDIELTITPYDKRAGAILYPCHALGACGFPMLGYSRVVAPATSFGTIPAEEKAFAAYHPLSQAVNNSRLCVERGPTTFWASQGDYGATAAYLIVRKAQLAVDKEGAYIAEYNGFFYDGAAGGVELLGDPRTGTGYAYAGQRLNEEPCWVEQIWMPVRTTATQQMRGPFEMLLFALLSTGTPGTNHATYDALPLDISLAIPSAIVDTASFLEADTLIAGSALAARHLHVIGEPITMADLLKRECKLFGFFLAWDRGKLRLRNLRHNAYDTWTETLGDKDKITPSEWPGVEWSHDTVINCWKCKVRYDLDTGKYGPEITIRNARSREALRVTKSTTIEHPGICIDDPAANVIALLESELLAGADSLGFPVGVVNVSLAHTKMLRVSVGDVVLYTSSLQYDPFGSGLMSTSCYALVVDCAWKYASRRGRATLLQMSRYAASEKPPWAAAALVDITASNGGWNATTKQLTLVPHYIGDPSYDSKDGATLQAGYKISIIESGSASWEGISDPLMFSPHTIAKAFEADGANILTLVDGPGTTWDPEKEYVVVPGAYGDCTLAQKADGFYLGDPDLHTFESNVAQCKLWGG